jgi:hypothetical protein
MTKRSMAVLCAMVSAPLVLGACETTTDREQRAERLQLEAVQKRAEAEQKAKQEQAKAVLDQQTAKDEMSYGLRVQKELDSVDCTMSSLQDSADKATGSAKAQDDQVMSDLAARKDTLAQDLKQITVASTNDWNGLRAKVDRDLDDLKKSLRTASTTVTGAPRSAGGKPQTPTGS